MSKRPSDSAAQPDNPAVVNASCASADSSAWPGWATATRRAARASGGPTGSSSCTSRSPKSTATRSAPVDEVTGGANGLDRFGEHRVPRRTLGRQLAPSFAVGRGGQLELAAGERGLALPRIGPPRGIVEVGDDHRPPLDRRPGRDEQAAILIEDPALEILQLRRRIDPETLGQRDPRAPERPQRLRLAARSVQRQHVHGAEVLAPRMLHGQRLQLGDDLAMPAGVQIGLDARLEGGETDLAEPGDLAVQGAVGLDVGVRVPAPHRQRGPQQRTRRRRHPSSPTPPGRTPRTRRCRSRRRCTSTRRRRLGAR